MRPDPAASNAVLMAAPLPVMSRIRSMPSASSAYEAGPGRCITKRKPCQLAIDPTMSDALRATQLLGSFTAAPVQLPG
jgi:hypothetical protein